MGMYIRIYLHILQMRRFVEQKSSRCVYIMHRRYFIYAEHNIFTIETDAI